ncbi:MAG: helicase C-terminal domain-containing protein [Gemmatimonadota bacterium]|nr:helicase C-terminal domain-containing protein [Gemmatimonadota bacterium]
MSDLRLSLAAAEYIRVEIEKAGGREVCFLARVNGAREIVEPKAVARGNKAAVLAVAGGAEEGGVMIHNHPSGELEPSDADLGVAARVYEDGLGSAITNNQAQGLYVIVDPPAPRVVESLDVGALEALIGPEGPLAQSHPQYEDRPGQRDMLRNVTARYNQGGVALIEAGTGIGKSLAYLIPAAQWSLQNRERTVISTNTINLQEQLDRNDLPLVQGLMNDEIDWALVKGRGNYISIRRARLAAESAPLLFEDDRVEELGALIGWMEQTDDGSHSDLAFVPRDEIWEEVKSDPDICLRARCPHFQACFYQRARRNAASATLLVTNHHLLFTDLSVRIAANNFTAAAVLPAYRHLILDEAHNIEDAATSHLGSQATRTGMFRMLARFDRGGRGLLTALQKAFTERKNQPVAVELRSRIEERVRPALEEARVYLTRFLDALEPMLPTEAPGAVRIGTPELPEPVTNPDVQERLEGLLTALRNFESEVRLLRERIKGNEVLSNDLEGRILDLSSGERRLAGTVQALRKILSPEKGDEHSVRWLEWRARAKGRPGNLVMASAPVELGDLLREKLFRRLETVVFSSATRAVRGSFTFLRSRIGLEEELSDTYNVKLKVISDIIVSPFDLQNQVMLAVPTDLPEVNSPDGEFDGATAGIVSEMSGVVDGGLFVLFTSHGALRRVAKILRAEGSNFPLFVQGEEARSRLLEGFIQHGSGILLATASFWEGVDVPGRPLRGLIIPRLPFRVPTEPITAARVEAIERRGGNPFREFMLPLAALKLKQGFGRLIRTRDDRGGIVILDDRIVRKRYGTYLKESLPVTPFVKGPWSDVSHHLRQFYSGL